MILAGCRQRRGSMWAIEHKVCQMKLMKLVIPLHSVMLVRENSNMEILPGCILYQTTTAILYGKMHFLLM